MSRWSMLVLIVCLAALPACKKKKTGGGDDGTQPGGEPGAPPVGASSDFVLYAHLRAKDIRDSVLVSEVKQALTKAFGAGEWDKFEGDAAREIGVKPTEIDSLSLFVTEVPVRAEPKLVVIVNASKPIVKAGVLGIGPNGRPDARGFYATRGAGGLVHFPDDRTYVVLHKDVAQKYLDGYAKGKSGWPMNAELSRAAAGHTLFAQIQFDKIPQDLTRGITNDSGLSDLAPALSARRITVTADLKGKELTIGGRVSFPDAASAGSARDSVQKFLNMAVTQVERMMNGKGPPEFAGMEQLIGEAHRALKEAKVNAAGSELIVAASVKANFDVGAMAVAAVQRIKGKATDSIAKTNLKQIGLALHNYSDITGGVLPIYAIGAKGQPLKNQNDKPLLSWRVAILPLIEQDNLYKQFKLDEPWDSPHNKALIPLMPRIFAPESAGKPGYTHLQMVVGPGALSHFGMRMPVSFPDGTSNTIAVVEAANPVIWTKPDDIILQQNQWPKDFRKRFGGQRPGGFNALMWDGSVRTIRDSVSDQTLGIALNPRDGLPLPADW